jgi:hypothetical protein
MEITVKDIINWIVDHSDDEEAMTKIAVTAYPFSSKFKNRYPDRRPFNRGDEDDGDFPIDVKI